ncbi:Outer membrane protein TolC [Flavobacterium sp. CF108]|uniref:TolC family protein n=1 Tax=unclassified Flavobacterium TaxID=196869 RepID=UPI0008C5E577|nr:MULTISPECIES: TolC family protein [unclassified Flavobacterium]SEO94574.1 Outer membrane efflux protein [Flavobacterium sp. fv08]SHH82631.1 Outer membrane protein TolC [Flavobacterium sp. CF108]
MNIKNNIKTAIILFLISKSAIAQQSWTLDQCIDYAVEHNLKLNEYKYNFEANKETHKQSVRSLLPAIEGVLGYSTRYGRSIDPINNNYTTTSFFTNEYTLQSSVDLFKGFQKINTIRLTKLLQNAAQQDLLHEKYMLAFRVMAAFYDIYFYQGLVVISKEQLEISQTNYDLVKRKIDLGLKAGTDLYEAESTLVSDKLLLTQHENSLAIAQLKLIQEMNLGDISKISLAEPSNEFDMPDNDPALEDYESIFKTAKSFVPLIKSEEFKTQAAMKDVSIAKGALYPTLTLFGAYGTGYYETSFDENGKTIPFKNQFSNNAAQQVGFSLKIPIFNGWSAHSNIKQKKIEFERANNNLNLQKQELYRLIQELVQNQKAFEKEFEQSNQKIATRELAFKIEQRKYELGLISDIDLYQSKTLYANSKNENLQVKIKLKVNKKTLDFYKGLSIFNIKN